MKETVIFDNVTFSYGRRNILEDFNLVIREGERVCLTGESGLGKTTALRLICGLEKPCKGTVTVNAGKISVCFQDNRLMPFRTVAENVTFYTGKKDRDRGMKILEELGLEGAKDKYPSELSGGMERRVSIAVALVYGGDLFIFDEPMNGLDDENTVKTAEVINRYTEGKTLILISHNKTDADLLGAEPVKMK